MLHLIAMLYAIISLMFASNLIKLYQKYKQGNNKITVYSIAATISLVVMFVALTAYFVNFDPLIVIGGQAVLLSTMMFIFYKNSKK